MDYKKWFKRYWYLRDWLKARKFNPKDLDKGDLFRALASRNLYIRKQCQLEIGHRMAGPILAVIENAPPIKKLYPENTDYSKLPSIPLDLHPNTMSDNDSHGGCFHCGCA